MVVQRKCFPAGMPACGSFESVKSNAKISAKCLKTERLLNSNVITSPLASYLFILADVVLGVVTHIVVAVRHALQ